MTELHQQLDHYASPAVRDLVWALLSPTLINASNANHNPSARWYQEAFHLIEPHLAQLNQDDSPLLEHLAARSNQRLGLYFERLWSYWLLHNDRYQLLAHNQQLMQDGQTLGEFDLIVHDTAADQIEHWELAVKFYLGIPPLGDMNHWFGAHTRDRLDLKYCHLVDKQLVLSETYPGRKALEAQGWQISQRRLISKGRLYYPWPQTESRSGTLPKCIDPAHLKGCWLTHSRFFNHAAQQPTAHYRWLDKTEWLVLRTSPPVPFTAIQSMLEQQLHPHPVQLWIDGWQTVPFRLFVVPDDWETQALATLPSQ